MKEVINAKTINFIKEVYNRPDIIDNPTCYIYDLGIIKKNVELLEKYAPSQISLYYAMKANSNKKIMSFIRNFNFVKGIEIASSGELGKACKFYKANEIIFTGPGKTEKELELSIKNNIRLLNVESVVEAIRINNIAEKLNVDKVDILLRINTNYYITDAYASMAGISTKMGIDEDKYIDSFSIINKLERVNVKGIHVFAASGILEYKSLIKYVDYVFQLSTKLEKATGKIDIIDFGGGLGVDYSNKNRIFDVQEFFKELSILINKYQLNEKELIMELGTYIVANAGYYTSKIIDIKEIKGHKHIITAGGVNHMGLPIEMRKTLPVNIIPMNNNKLYDKQTNVYNETADISGPLCMDRDKLTCDVYINNANIGDIIVYKQSGAYCYSLSVLEFLSHPYPEEIIIPHE